MQKLSHALTALVLSGTFCLSSIVSVVTPVAPAVLGTAALTAVLVTQSACDKPTLVDHAKRVVRAVKGARDIFASNGVNAARLDRMIDLGDRLTTALDNSASTDTLQLASELITEFDLLIAQDVVRISNPTTRTIVLVALYAGNEALHYIADELARQANKASSPIRAAAMNGARTQQLNTVKKFNKKKRWQCRNSINGQFAKMSYCDEHPDTSQVETY